MIINQYIFIMFEVCIHVKWNLITTMPFFTHTHTYTEPLLNLLYIVRYFINQLQYLCISCFVVSAAVQLHNEGLLYILLFEKWCVEMFRPTLIVQWIEQGAVNLWVWFQIPVFMVLLQ